MKYNNLVTQDMCISAQIQLSLEILLIYFFPAVGENISKSMINISNFLYPSKFKL